MTILAQFEEGGADFLSTGSKSHQLAARVQKTMHINIMLSTENGVLLTRLNNFDRFRLLFVVEVPVSDFKDGRE